MSDGILIIDCRERSVEFSLFTLAAGARAVPQRRLRGVLGGIRGHCRFSAWDRDGNPLNAAGELPPGTFASHDQAIAMLAEWLPMAARDLRITGVAHRVLHGGERETAEVVEADTVDRLRELVPIAPAHQTYNLLGIEAAGRRFARSVQVACFDTAFHQRQPEVARMLALPAPLSQSGLLRYGYHGLTFQSVRDLVWQRAEAPPARLIAVHLGRHASLCALRNGRSVAASGGFAPLDGMPGSTSAGDLCPGALLYLMREHGYSQAQIEFLLNHRAGLLGVSGFSADMRDLLESNFPRAGLAVEWFCYRVVRELGSLAAALQGLDGVVFSGRIGLSAAPIRTAICRNSRWLGLELEEQRNETHQDTLHAEHSKVRIWVVRSEADQVMADQAAALLSPAARSASAEG